jgi:hypothetical protein
LIRSYYPDDNGQFGGQQDDDGEFVEDDLPDFDASPDDEKVENSDEKQAEQKVEEEGCDDLF